MKIDRLLAIIITLLKEDKVTAPYLAEKFEVSRRTINRDIDSICKAGLPILTLQGAKGGISFADGYKIDKTLFTNQELRDIFTGLATLGSVAKDQRYQHIIDKFSKNKKDVVNPTHMLIDLSSHYKESLAPKIELIQKAIEQNTVISFNYYNKNGEKTVLLEPYLIVFQWSAWYILGTEQEKEAFKLYKLNRLWDLKAEDIKFVFKEIPNAQLDFASYFTKEIEAVILFEPNAEYRLIEEYGIDSFSHTAENKLYFKFSFTNKDYLLQWLLSFKNEAELLEPEYLRKEIKEILQSALNKY